MLIDMLFHILNQVLQPHGIRLTQTGRHYGSYLKAIDQKGRGYIVPVWSVRPGYLGARSVLRVRKGCRARWRINGQASTGTREVLRWGERGPVVRLSKTQYRGTQEDLFSVEDVPEYRRVLRAKNAVCAHLADEPQYSLAGGREWHPITQEVAVQKRPTMARKVSARRGKEFQNHATQ